MSKGLWGFLLILSRKVLFVRVIERVGLEPMTLSSRAVAGSCFTSFKAFKGLPEIQMSLLNLRGVSFPPLQGTVETDTLHFSHSLKVAVVPSFSAHASVFELVCKAAAYALPV